MTGNDVLCNQTELFCKEFDAGTCEDIQFTFNGNWTTETLVTQVLSILMRHPYISIDNHIPETSESLDKSIFSICDPNL